MENLQQITRVSGNIATASAKAVGTLHKLIFETVPKDRRNRRRLREFTGFRFSRESSEYVRKTEYIDSNFSEVDLAAVCSILCLDHDGTKAELIERICSSLVDLNELAESCADEAEEENESEEDEGMSGVGIGDEVRRSGGECFKERMRQSDDGSEEDERGIQERRGRKNVGLPDSESRGRFALTFRDIEGSIRVFDGSEGFPVQQWIREFEEMAILMGWDKMQTLVFAKKSLAGIARLFIQSEQGVYSWGVLKKLLKEEFEVRESSAEIHERMKNRKKKKDESIREYFLSMKEIASRGRVDDRSLMRYTIDGIDDDSGTKVMLYGATSLKQFKEKMCDYEVVRQKMLQKTVSGERAPKSSAIKKGAATLDLSKLCYNCGGKDGHKSAECRFKNRGKKCFGCGEFGHVAVNCPQKATGAERKSTVNIANETPARLKTKEIQIQGQKIDALIDTGCQLNLLREDMFERVGAPSLQQTDMVLTGFGKNFVTPRGYFSTELEVEDEVFVTDFYVVSQDTMRMPAIIGCDLLDQAQLVISENTVTMSRLKTEAPIMHITVKKGNELDIDDLESVEPIKDKDEEKSEETDLKDEESKTTEENVEAMKIEEKEKEKEGENEKDEKETEEEKEEEEKDAVEEKDKDKPKEKEIENVNQWKKNIKKTKKKMKQKMKKKKKKMNSSSDWRIKQMIDEELIHEFEGERDNAREEAKIQIYKIQQENRKTFNRSRRTAKQYEVDELVAVKRTQFGPGLKLKKKFLGPYRIIKVKLNDTYDVEREGTHEGPRKTSTCAEYMKPWITGYPSGADGMQDGRLWDSDLTDGSDSGGKKKNEGDVSRDRVVDRCVRRKEAIKDCYKID